ncbi:unnamed protein product [Aspergillus oryzae]|uniref:Unnamed protein product n=2 Tax=Aspergillus oryzae TaxID=5062 RepID=A0AAN4YGQ3_ASPOZ|nr:unnamed protein product [Aspergillus oryzae]GMF95785.1 unnamed protein product [Aspergillus oryzae]GMG26876.1 unnamed protein product [Aspergillus oryzae]GMG54815.1 unnamed protein product [Aspergillus oryzae var. brunneus]
MFTSVHTEDRDACMGQTNKRFSSVDSRWLSKVDEWHVPVGNTSSWSIVRDGGGIDRVPFQHDSQPVTFQGSRGTQMAQLDGLPNVEYPWLAA